MEEYFNFSEFQKNLKTKQIGRCFIYRLTTESTMILSKREIEEGGPSGTLVLSEQQTGGKGREKREWVSKPHGNLYFTFHLKEKTYDNFFKINLLIPIAITTALLDFEIKAKIKWPNDVWVNGKKISGMLIDIDDKIDYKALNIGII
jgi:BirA family biotin operon repressor/biotin-[acetyl-CoA-carboxylase] ligase